MSSPSFSLEPDGVFGLPPANRKSSSTASFSFKSVLQEDVRAGGGSGVVRFEAEGAFSADVGFSVKGGKRKGEAKAEGNIAKGETADARLA